MFAAITLLVSIATVLTTVLVDRDLLEVMDVVKVCDCKIIHFVTVYTYPVFEPVVNIPTLKVLKRAFITM